MAARLAYALLFTVALPLLLLVWARAVTLAAPVPFDAGTGQVLLGIGAVLMLLGAWRLWIEGGGLPMNAFPPPRLARGGVFSIFPHPMYLGFSLACFGAALTFRSSSGYWLVAPTAAFGATALVLGYEKRALFHRFGVAIPRFLPPADSARATLPEMLQYWWFAEIPWVGLYYSAAAFGVPRDAFDPSLPFEPVPIIPISGLFYWSEYLAVIISPFLARTRHDLRRYFVRTYAAIVIAFLLYFTVPSTAPRPPLPEAGWLTDLLAWERGQYPASVAFPSFHVMWALLIARLAQDSRRAPWFWWPWAICVSASCIFTGMHWILDAVVGAAFALVLFRYEQAWSAIRGATEWVANSWCEWRMGPVRIMNQALPAGIAAGVGIWIAGSFAGPDRLGAVLLAAAAAMAGSGLWAQVIEGSPRLLRPFGFYGALLGGAIAAAVCPDPWWMLAAFAVAAPAVQGIGRIRCLVNGCCHGDRAPGAVGIRYDAPQTRPAALANLRGQPIYPVQLFSIAANLMTFLLLRRMWSAGASLELICGVYLIANGIARFAEEGYRGEPQTPVLAGLRLYQWLAVACVIAGAVVTTMGSTPSPAMRLGAAPLLGALVFAVFAAVAFGVDLPRSKWRLSRLSAGGDERD
ncbi:MAG: prolipoprotein diacylglyceryl transferase family protein [Bryobacteraceae bacterium]